MMFGTGLFSFSKTGKLPNAPPIKLPKKAALATCERNFKQNAHGQHIQKGRQN
jgi:hypothetical protein